MAENEKCSEPGRDKNELQIMKVLILNYIKCQFIAAKCVSSRVLSTSFGIHVFCPSLFTKHLTETLVSITTAAAVTLTHLLLLNL